MKNFMPELFHKSWKIMKFFPLEKFSGKRKILYFGEPNFRINMGGRIDIRASDSEGSDIRFSSSPTLSLAIVRCKGPEISVWSGPIKCGHRLI